MPILTRLLVAEYGFNVETGDSRTMPHYPGLLCFILYCDREGLICCVWMHRPTWTFSVRICLNFVFSRHGSTACTFQAVLLKCRCTIKTVHWRNEYFYTGFIFCTFLEIVTTKLNYQMHFSEKHATCADSESF